jgi:hypothetical protein
MTGRMGEILWLHSNSPFDEMDILLLHSVSALIQEERESGFCSG